MAQSTHSKAWTGSERRSGVDRRQISILRADWRWIYRGRRKWGRRADDQPPPDWRSPRMLLVVVGVFLLSAADAFLTLTLLRSGQVVEANPFMRALIEHEVQVFINVKAVMTGWGLLVLVACSHVTVLRRIPVRRVIAVLLGLYLLLVGWELYLLRSTMA